jgi:lipopolysaccharide export system permease protein
MRLIERYLFRQLLGPAALAVVSLTAVALLSQSLAALDVIVDHGQSAGTFLKITMLALPQLLSLILPIALFVGILVALNRLHTEQEIVVCFAGGLSRWKVIGPAVRLACFAVVISLAMNLWIHPISAKEMRTELFKVRTDLASTLVQEGQFTEPSPGLTVYARKVGAQGRLESLFVHQQTDGGGASTFTAQEGRIATRNGKPVLIMRQGSNQEFSKAGVLNYLTFNEYIFDLAPFVAQDEIIHYKVSDRYLHELLFPDLTQEWEQQNRTKMLAEAHGRLSGPLYNIAFVLMAVAAVLAGGFSRMGYGRRIAMVSGAAIVVRVVGFAVQAACDDNSALNVVQYLVPLAASGWALKEIFRQRISRFIAINAPHLPPSGALQGNPA